MSERDQMYAPIISSLSTATIDAGLLGASDFVLRGSREMHSLGVYGVDLGSPDVVRDTTSGVETVLPRPRGLVVAGLTS